MTIDIKKLAQLSGLDASQIDDKTIGKLENTIGYLDILAQAETEASGESENISNITNDSNRNSGLENFDNTQGILANIHHKIINNSAVLEFDR